MTYESSGVNIDAGNALIDAIKPLAAATSRSGCNVSLGGFGGCFDLKAAGYEDPILVSGTDGVGTKLKVWGIFVISGNRTNEQTSKQINEQQTNEQTNKK